MAGERGGEGAGRAGHGATTAFEFELRGSETSAGGGAARMDGSLDGSGAIQDGTHICFDGWFDDGSGLRAHESGTTLSFSQRAACLWFRTPRIKHARGAWWWDMRRPPCRVVSNGPGTDSSADLRQHALCCGAVALLCTGVSPSPLYARWSPRADRRTARGKQLGERDWGWVGKRPRRRNGQRREEHRLS